MTIENTTPNRGYQLPNAANLLEDDVARLIAAIMGIDLDVAAMLVAIAGKADAAHSHVIADITGLAAALTAKQDVSGRGAANGYAALGNDGKVPAAQLPDALFGALTYQGDWNANTNSPTIPAASAANKGWYYIVSTAGTTTVSGVNDWEVGDWIVSDGVRWDKIDNTDAVSSIAGLRGAITAAALKTALAIANIASVGTSTTITGSLTADGLSLGSAGAASATDLTKHLRLYGASWGMNLYGNTIGFVGGNASANFAWYAASATPVASLSSDGSLTLKGKASLGAAPTTNMDAATKGYVDNSIAAIPSPNPMPSIAAAAVGGIGTAGFFRRNLSATGFTANPGDTVAGSELNWTDVDSSLTSDAVGDSPSGTWKILGCAKRVGGFGTQAFSALYVRIA
jgi:hypothetical protein